MAQTNKEEKDFTFTFDEDEDELDFDLEEKDSEELKKQEKKSKENQKQKKEQEEKEEQDESPSKSMIFIVKVTTNKEARALDMVADKIKRKNLNVYTIARPHGLRGYILLEAPDRENAEEAVFNLPYVKGIIPKVISYAEVKPMLEPATAEVKIEKNDIVEIIGEAFKKEKAKVIRVDKTKEEVVVSLLSSVVPIPATIKLDNVRVIRRDEQDELDDEVQEE